MLTPTNALDCIEIAAYSVQDVEGGRVIRYLQRGPGEASWEPVKLFQPAETATCRTCGETVPRGSLSDGVCVPCLWPQGD